MFDELMNCIASEIRLFEDLEIKTNLIMALKDLSMSANQYEYAQKLIEEKQQKN